MRILQHFEMADGDGSQNERSSNSRKNSNSDEINNDGHGLPLGLDLGDEMTGRIEPNCPENTPSSSSSLPEPARREDNPFSFKHFLRDDTNGKYKGARPKVYCDGRPVAEPPKCRVVPEYSSTLPDFVQDHLVIEQCYLNSDSNGHYGNVDSLPDFTQGSNKAKNHMNAEQAAENGQDHSIPFDLPLRPQAGFPLDLPFTNNSPSTSARNSNNTDPLGISKSLPDFLADGAVCSQDSEGVSSTQSPEREGDRLKRQLEETRRLLAEQTQRADRLNKVLEIVQRNRDYPRQLEKNVDELRENLERTNKRALLAEANVLKLRQEIKYLKNDLAAERASKYDEEGAVGGPSTSHSNDVFSQRLAQELRSAASSAEMSLRQLLTGVDNLRVMANSLENMQQRSEEKDEFLDLDNRSGPAL